MPHSQILDLQLCTPIQLASSKSNNFSFSNLRKATNTAAQICQFKSCTNGISIVMDRFYLSFLLSVQFPDLIGILDDRTDPIPTTYFPVTDSLNNVILRLPAT
jgi:hypothetical protein